MRLAIVICGFALVASPAFSQTKNVFMPAPTEPMMLQTATRTAATPLKAAGAKAQVADPQLDRQVSATQQKIQLEERKLQSQFAQLDKMRTAAIDKQNQKELERIQRLEKQVVAEYQKRVDQILIGAQAQIQATTVHVQPNQPTKAQAARTPTRAQPTRAPSRSSSRSPQAQQTRTKSTGTAKTQSQKQPTKSTQKRSTSRYGWFGRR